MSEEYFSGLIAGTAKVDPETRIVLPGTEKTYEQLEGLVHDLHKSFYMLTRPFQDSERDLSRRERDDKDSYTDISFCLTQFVEHYELQPYSQRPRETGNAFRPMLNCEESFLAAKSLKGYIGFDYARHLTETQKRLIKHIEEVYDRYGLIEFGPQGYVWSGMLARVGDDLVLAESMPLSFVVSNKELLVYPDSEDLKPTQHDLRETLSMLEEFLDENEH